MYPESSRPLPTVDFQLLTDPGQPLFHRSTRCLAAIPIHQFHSAETPASLGSLRAPEVGWTLPTGTSENSPRKSLVRLFSSKSSGRVRLRPHRLLKRRRNSKTRSRRLRVPRSSTMPSDRGSIGDWTRSSSDCGLPQVRILRRTDRIRPGTGGPWNSLHRTPTSKEPPRSAGHPTHLAHELHLGHRRGRPEGLPVRGKYRDVILPMTAPRRLGTVLEDTKHAALDMETALDRTGVVEQEAAPRRPDEVRSNRGDNTGVDG